MTQTCDHQLNEVLERAISNPSRGWDNRWMVGVFVTLMLACMGGAYLAGTHIGNGDIHQTGDAKARNTRSLIDREVGPRLDRIEERLGSIERKLGEQ